MSRPASTEGYKRPSPGITDRRQTQFDRQRGAQMSAEFPTLAEVLQRHQWSIIRHTCRCDDPGTHGEWPRHVADAWREACTIRTVAQLDALPRDTVVVDAAGIPRTKRYGNSHMPGGWTHAGTSPLTSRELADGRDMVIAWHPDWSKS